MYQFCRNVSSQERKKTYIIKPQNKLSDTYSEREVQRFYENEKIRSFIDGRCHGSIHIAGWLWKWCIKMLCKAYNVPFVINDNVDIALEMDADGVHVGQSDMEAGDVRAKLGPDKIIGVSAQTVEQAVLAEKRGADYLGVGAVFPTSSKDDATEVPYETLKAICQAVSIPVIAIGGITKDNVAELSGSGICGIAVISAIYGQKNIKVAAANLKMAVKKIID